MRVVMAAAVFAVMACGGARAELLNCKHINGLDATVNGVTRTWTYGGETGTLTDTATRNLYEFTTANGTRVIIVVLPGAQPQPQILRAMYVREAYEAEVGWTTCSVLAGVPGDDKTFGKLAGK
jgi:hypothetical protein